MNTAIFGYSPIQNKFKINHVFITLAPFQEPARMQVPHIACIDLGIPFSNCVFLLLGFMCDKCSPNEPDAPVNRTGDHVLGTSARVQPPERF